MAATRLNNLQLGDIREDKIMELVATGMHAWRTDAIDAFDDCKEIFEHPFDRLINSKYDQPVFVAQDAVGTWIILNILGRSPQTEEECELVRATGLLITQAFYDWWDIK